METTTETVSDTVPSERVEVLSPPPFQTLEAPIASPHVPPALPSMPHANASRSLAGLFDLNISVAVLAIVADVVLFAGDVCTLGGMTPIIFFFAIVLGVITYLIQTNWHRDDRNSALIKSLIIFFLTALPGPITPLFAVPAALVSVVRKIRGR
jgi:hypothetical protein